MIEFVYFCACTRLHDIPTLDFPTPSFWTSQPQIPMGLKSSWLKSLGLNSPGLKLWVEKFRVEMSFNRIAAILRGKLVPSSSYVSPKSGMIRTPEATPGKDKLVKPEDKANEVCTLLIKALLKNFLNPFSYACTLGLLPCLR